MIKRYEEHPDGGMREDELGAYVKYEDIEHVGWQVWGPPHDEGWDNTAEHNIEFYKKSGTPVRKTYVVENKGLQCMYERYTKHYAVDGLWRIRDGADGSLVAHCFGYERALLVEAALNLKDNKNDTSLREPAVYQPPRMGKQGG